MSKLYLKDKKVSKREKIIKNKKDKTKNMLVNRSY